MTQSQGDGRHLGVPSDDAVGPLRQASAGLLHEITNSNRNVSSHHSNESFLPDGDE